MRYIVELTFKRIFFIEPPSYLSFELILLLICICLSALYSGAESAILSISVDRAKQLIEQGGLKTSAMQFLLDKSHKIITTILIANNLVNIVITSITTLITEQYFHSSALTASVVVSTILIVYCGEIVPKTLGRTYAEKVSVPAIRFVQFTYYLLYPVIEFTGWLVTVVLRDHAESYGRLITKQDIEYMVDKAEREKSIDSKQIELLSSILEFPTIKVKDIMISRREIKWVEESASFHDVLNMIREHNHSRFPVCRGEIDETVGFLHVKDLAYVVGEEKVKDFNIANLLKAPFFVYEHMKIQAVFDHMNKKKVHLAMVKDENGLVVGIVTLEDIVEEIFGDIRDEHDTEEHDTPDDILRKTPEGVVLEGTISLRDLYQDFDVKIPLNDNYSTLAGFILDMLGNNFPEAGQIIVWEGYSFEIQDVDEYEVKKVLIKHVDGEHIYNKKDAHQNSED